jgi:dolichol-phosphate mannosyltransferase
MQNPIRSLAIVIPVFNEAEGIPALLSALREFRAGFDGPVRVIFVDDHSGDASPDMLRRACAGTDWFSYIRLSRRSGSHVAIIAGLAQATEGCAVFLSADLQDPPSLIPRMVALCGQGHDVVWAVQEGGESRRLDEALSAVFHSLMRVISNVGELPFRCSFALLSRRAYRHLVENASAFPSLLVDIPRLGFAVGTVPFRKPPRAFGRSKWNLSHKIKLLFDSMVSASYLPLQAMIYVGLGISGLGFLYALFLIIRQLVSEQPMVVQGWTSLMVVVLVLGGTQMLMTGIIGQYLWRTSENARRQKLYLVEDSAGLGSAPAENAGEGSGIVP